MRTYQPETPHRGLFRPLFWLLFAAALAAGIWWAGRAHSEQLSAAPLRAGAVHTVRLLVTAPERALIGRAVQVQDAKVESALSNHEFWAGQGSHRVFVFLPESKFVMIARNQAVDLHSGATIDLNGLVEHAPGVRQAEGELGLSPAQARELNRDGLYVKAESVQVVEEPAPKATPVVRNASPAAPKPS